MKRTVSLSAILSLVAIALVIVCVPSRRSARADHFQEDSLSSSEWGSCGTNCQEYDFTLTMKKIGKYCRYFVLSQPTLEEGVIDTFYNDQDDPDQETWNYWICASTSPDTVSFTVRTDGGPHSVLIVMYHDEDQDGSIEAGEKEFDDLTVQTSG